MKLLRLLPILILSLLLACPGYAADGTISDQTALGAQPAVDDTFPIWDASAGATKKVTYANMVDIRNADSYGGLAAAVTAIGSTKTTIIINSAQAVAGDLSIPTTLSLICLQSADIVVAATKTLTVNGEIIAGDYQIFSGSGTTTISSRGWVNAKWTGGSSGALKLADSNLLDLSSINASSATEGLKLPQAADVSAATAEGQISWDSDDDKLYVGDGAAVVEIGGGGGVSDKTIYIDAGAMLACTTSGAASGKNEYAVDKAEWDYFAFDGATDERVQFKLVMPEDWDRSTIKAKFYWSDDGNGDANETVAWAIKAAAISNDDPLATTAFGTAVVATADTWIAANDLHLTAATGAITVGGTPALGDMVMFEIYRDVSADTMDDDARLFGVLIQYKATNAVAAW